VQANFGGVDEVTIRVFIENEAGSNVKNYHDKKTLVFHRRRVVAHAYPFLYGFILGTTAGDGCNVDCFVVTSQALKTGQVVECKPIGLMEQFEDGVDDHNVLARLADESVQVTSAVQSALTEHVLACFADVPGKQMAVGRFLGAADARRHVESRWDST
jgi:inorganic pyrophosphatase